MWLSTDHFHCLHCLHCLVPLVHSRQRPQREAPHDRSEKRSPTMTVTATVTARLHVPRIVYKEYESCPPARATSAGQGGGGCESLPESRRENSSQCEHARTLRDISHYLGPMLPYRLYARENSGKQWRECVLRQTLTKTLKRANWLARRTKRIHRACGRLYVGSCLILC
jgi:hypothetical protein